jgi:hypothetical protein
MTATVKAAAAAAPAAAVPAKPADASKLGNKPVTKIALNNKAEWNKAFDAEITKDKAAAKSAYTKEVVAHVFALAILVAVVALTFLISGTFLIGLGGALTCSAIADHYSRVRTDHNALTKSNEAVKAAVEDKEGKFKAFYTMKLKFAENQELTLKQFQEMFAHFDDASKSETACAEFVKAVQTSK